MKATQGVFPGRRDGVFGGDARVCGFVLCQEVQSAAADVCRRILVSLPASLVHAGTTRRIKSGEITSSFCRLFPRTRPRSVSCAVVTHHKSRLIPGRCDHWPSGGKSL